MAEPSADKVLIRDWSFWLDTSGAPPFATTRRANPIPPIPIPFFSISSLLHNYQSVNTITGSVGRERVVVIDASERIHHSVTFYLQPDSS